MATVMVTGGAGYIGTILTDALLKKGYKVVCLDRLFFGREKVQGFIDNPNYVLVQDDIRYFDRSVLQGVDAVVDMAALSNDPLGELDRELTLSINYAGRMRVCHLAKEMGVKKYVLASSCSVYGYHDGWCDEQTKPNPNSTYALANLKAEECLACADRNFAVTVLRQATVFGVSPRMRFDLAVNTMTLRAFKDGAIYILGQGMQWRPFVHVRDAAAVIVSVLESDPAATSGQVFNVGSNENNSRIVNLAYTIREALPFEIQVKIAPDDADKRNYRVKFDKIATALKFRPDWGIREGALEVYSALKTGEVWDTPDTVTLNRYTYLLEAERLLKDVVLRGKVL
jgi:nucleoside-diphosphate-sugar epimerase